MASAHSQVAATFDLRPIIICGPSRVGKDTLIKRLIESHPDKFSLAVSHTTRQPRRGEVPGKDYNFVPRSFFSFMIYRDSFVEHISYRSEYYGTSKETITSQRRNRIVLLNINMEGVETVKKSQRPSARYVFVKPTCSHALQAELRARGTENESSIRKRVCRAIAEVAHAETSGAYQIILTDDDINKVYDRLESFALGI
ncbi:guanylate kinase [Fusarium sporotrichioides]|uniref:Guanylate kinase n=1 Tax=Fusarium sporotrichioides TaxID=5514 RepID=A0A395SAQ0_FUSSP|nr:guanylate kinase [Fusarium sporotrichioides]